jgi:hypothetical protein
MNHSDEENRNKLRGNSVVMHFDFPEDVKISCEAYLLAFTQYLINITGTEATASVRHEEGRVIFEVLPVNNGESIEAIYKALADYLRLNEAGNLLDKFGNKIAVQSHEANSNKLTNQSTPARAKFELENMTPYSEYIPPRLGERILLLVLHTKEERANIPGDLEEEFKQIAAKHGERYAKLWYYKQVAASAWPMILKTVKVGLLAWVEEWIRRRVS